MKLNLKYAALPIAIGMIASASHSFGQDAHFSQFYMAPLSQNPASAGANYDLQAILNYKDQWRNVEAPFRTFAFSYDMRLMSSGSKGGFLAAGINLVNDRAGSSRMGYTNATLALTYHVRLGANSTLGLGVQSGMLQRNVDLNLVSWGMQYDGSAYNPALNSGENLSAGGAFTKFDMSTGLLWTYDNTSGGRNNAGSSDLKINLGVSAQHLTQPDFSFVGSDERLYMRYVAHGNALIGISDSRFAIVPGFMYYRQGPAQEIYAGSLFRYVLSRSTEYMERTGGAAIYLGSYYRFGDAVSTHLLIDYAQFTFGLSYDINISSLTTASNGRGGLELSIAFVGSNIFKSKGGGASSMD
jgi:type IX secretion system PorP/SprF family membrane protein